VWIVPGSIAAPCRENEACAGHHFFIIFNMFAYPAMMHRRRLPVASLHSNLQKTDRRYDKTSYFHKNV
jgi:hypothetical protein